MQPRRLTQAECEVILSGARTACEARLAYCSEIARWCCDQRRLLDARIVLEILTPKGRKACGTPKAHEVEASLNANHDGSALVLPRSAPSRWASLIRDWLASRESMLERPPLSAEQRREFQEQAKQAREWVAPVDAVLASLGPVVDGTRQSRSYHHLVLDIANEAALVVANALRRKRSEDIEASFTADGAREVKPRFSFAVPMRWGMPPTFDIEDQLRIVEGIGCEYDRAIAYPTESIERLTEKALVGPDVWSAVQSAKTLPSWSVSTGILTYRGRVAKRIKNIKLAKRVVPVLNDFQEMGWPQRIDSPLPGGKGRHVRDTAKDMNIGCELIKFEPDGTASGFRWRAV